MRRRHPSRPARSQTHHINQRHRLVGRTIRNPRNRAHWTNGRQSMAGESISPDPDSSVEAIAAIRAHNLKTYGIATPETVGAARIQSNLKRRRRFQRRPCSGTQPRNGPDSNSTFMGTRQCPTRQKPGHRRPLRSARLSGEDSTGEGKTHGRFFRLGRRHPTQRRCVLWRGPDLKSRFGEPSAPETMGSDTHLEMNPLTWCVFLREAGKTRRFRNRIATTNVPLRE